LPTDKQAMRTAKKIKHTGDGSGTCIKKFLYYFRKGFYDHQYMNWERGYKLNAHRSFSKVLDREKFEFLLEKKSYACIAKEVIRIESRTNLLFSFEKIALRDALKDKSNAKSFAVGLYEYLYSKNELKDRFEHFAEIIASLPRKQTRVFTWPVVTVFGFIGNPHEHMFLKPTVTKKAAEKYSYNFLYRSAPNWETYQSLLRFAAQIKKDTKELKPKDQIDLQSFIWVSGSEEYPD
jgi:hypothetical protein